MKKLLSFMTIATLLVSCNLEFKSLESAIEDFENDGDYTNVQVSEIEHFNTLAGAVGGTKVTMSTLDFDFGTVNYQENIFRLNPETGENEFVDPALVTADDIDLKVILNDETAEGEILTVEDDSAGLFVDYKLNIAKVVVFYVLEYNSPEAAELFVQQSLATGLYLNNSILQFGKYVFLGRVPGYEFQEDKQEIGPAILNQVARFSPTYYIVGENEEIVSINGQEVITEAGAELVVIDGEEFILVDKIKEDIPRNLQSEGRVIPTTYPSPESLEEVLDILAQGELKPLEGVEVLQEEIQDFLTATGADEAVKVTFNVRRNKHAVYMAKYGYVQDGYQMYRDSVIVNRAYDSNDIQINGTLIIWFTLPFPEYNAGLYQEFSSNQTVDEFWSEL
jgi:hypothetical protein